MIKKVQVMVKRSKGFRTKSRQRMRVNPRTRGKVPVTKSLQKFKVGDRAGLAIEPRIHRGHPHPKFQGKTGTIEGRQGSAYILKIRDGGKVKRLLVRPEHLKKV
jgi:large subunit ribosomal protein L21e